MKKSFRKLGMATAMVLTMVGFAACGDDDEATRMGGDEDETTAENKGESENYIQTKGEFLGRFVCYKIERVETIGDETRKKEEYANLYGWSDEFPEYAVVVKLSSNKYIYSFRNIVEEDDYKGVDYEGENFGITTEKLVIGKEYKVSKWDDEVSYPRTRTGFYFIKLTTGSTFEVHMYQESFTVHDFDNKLLSNPITYKSDKIHYFKRVE